MFSFQFSPTLLRLPTASVFREGPWREAGPDWDAPTRGRTLKELRARLGGTDRGVQFQDCSRSADGAFCLAVMIPHWAQSSGPAGKASTAVARQSCWGDQRLPDCLGQCEGQEMSTQLPRAAVQPGRDPKARPSRWPLQLLRTGRADDWQARLSASSLPEDSPSLSPSQRAWEKWQGPGVLPSQL